MVYLLNRPCPDLGMVPISEDRFVRQIRQSIACGDLVSALDEDTAKRLTDLIRLTYGHWIGDIPSIDSDVFQDATPNDISITLPDNLESCDIVLSTDSYGDWHRYRMYEKM